MVENLKDLVYGVQFQNQILNKIRIIQNYRFVELFEEQSSHVIVIFIRWLNIENSII